MLYIEVAIDLKDRSFIELSLNIIALQSNINFIVNFTGSKEYISLLLFLFNR